MYDDISSGLDSATTFSVVRTLADVCHALQRTAVVSLLQVGGRWRGAVRLAVICFGAVLCCAVWLRGAGTSCALAPLAPGRPLGLCGRMALGLEAAGPAEAGKSLPLRRAHARPKQPPWCLLHPLLLLAAQPPPEVFHLFDDVLLLTDGRVLYQ